MVAEILQKVANFQINKMFSFQITKFNLIKVNIILHLK